MRKRFFFKLLLQSAGIAALSLALAVVLFHFVFQPFQVAGLSMAPALEDSDYLLVDRVFFSWEELKRGDIVVFRSPVDQRFLVKRIAGLPGDHVHLSSRGQVTINGTREPSSALEDTSAKGELVVPEGGLYLLGDNAPLSQDSRAFGPVPAGRIYGRVLLRYFPPRPIPPPPPSQVTP